jgi:HSP20 family protein
MPKAKAKQAGGPVISVRSRPQSPPREADDAVAWMPPVDIYEADEHYVLNAEVPGVEPRDISIEISGKDVSIRGERRFDAVCSEESYQRLEGIRGRFFRTFSLPDRLDVGAIQAELKDGILEVILPKAQKQK